MSSQIVEFSEIDHVLEKPAMYFGDTSIEELKYICYDPKTDKLYKSTINYSYKLAKMFDEILTNATDNVARNKGTTSIKIYIKKSSISVWNNGKSIPITKQKSLDGKEYYTPEIAFGHLRSSSNYNKTDKRNFNGTNGLGAKLTNIFSKKFMVTIVDNKVKYTQLFENNLKTINPPTIENNVYEEDSICIKFMPINENIMEMVPVLFKRCWDCTICGASITVNNIQYKKHTLFSLAKYYAKLDNIEGDPLTYNFEGIQIAFWAIPNKGNTYSFVNGIATIDGGKHLDNFTHQLNTMYRNKFKTDTTSLKSYCEIVLNQTVINPEFTSQAKTKLATKINTDLSTFCDSILTNTSIHDYIVGKRTKKATKKSSELILDKLKDAEEACKMNGDCTLFICEGDSAAGMVMGAFKYLGCKKFGLYALTGKILNVAKASNDVYIKNKVVTGLVQTIGLEPGKKYKTTKGLRYGRVICVKDADVDGSDIMGLCINLFYIKFKDILYLDQGFFYEFITPILQIKTNNDCKEFYNMAEFNKYTETHEVKSEQVRYIKGLASITSKDIARYFQNFDRYLIRINPDEESDYWMNLAFGKNKENLRKQWVMGCTENKCLPRKESKPITMSQFVCYDLVCYAYDDCARSLPNIMDGLKISQRKILYTLLSQSNKESLKERKIFELVAEVTKKSAYLHGDASLTETIFGMMNDWCGSNNIPLLDYNGQIGKRLDGGKNHGAARYVFGMLNEISRYLFPSDDNELLNRVELEGKIVEPKYYVPIIPLVLINGALGIGTGFKCNIPEYNPLDCIHIIKERLENKKINNEDNEKHELNIRLCYPGFKGTFEKKYSSNTLLGYESSGIQEWFIPKENVGFWKHKYVSGDVNDPFSYNPVFIKISEVPIGISLNTIKDAVISAYNEDRQKLGTSIIIGIQDSSIAGDMKLDTIDEYNYYIKFSTDPKILSKYQFDGNVKDFIKSICNKLAPNTHKLSIRSMTMFNENEIIENFPTIKSIFDRWFSIRYDLYIKRKENLCNKKEIQLRDIYNKLKFIKLVINEKIEIRKVTKQSLKEQIQKFELINEKELVRIPSYMYTIEEFEKLMKETENIEKELEDLKNKSIEEFWLNDLKVLESKFNFSRFN